VNPVGIGSRGSRILGALTLVSMLTLALLALVVTPADQNQGEAVRLLYLHVGSVLVAFVAFGVTALGSLLYLWRKREFWDLLAAASAEVGVVLTALCLISGALWGRPVWGVYWTWDARLTSTALMFVMFCGYLALRKMLLGSPARAKWSAVAGLLAAVNLPIVHYSTVWWNSLHQGPTITKINPSISGSMLFTLMFSMVAFSLTYAWLLLQRFRVQFLELQAEDVGLDIAIAERRAEAGPSASAQPVAEGAR
jgi:heme exporter protein C